MQVVDHKTMMYLDFRIWRSDFKFQSFTQLYSSDSTAVVQHFWLHCSVICYLSLVNFCTEIAICDNKQFGKLNISISTTYCVQFNKIFSILHKFVLFTLVQPSTTYKMVMPGLSIESLKKHKSVSLALLKNITQLSRFERAIKVKYNFQNTIDSFFS